MATDRKRSRARKSISTARPRNYSDLYKKDSSGAQIVATPAGSPAPVVKNVDEVDWQKEYVYVFSDLRQLVLVSGILFALILIAGFFI